MTTGVKIEAEFYSRSENAFYESTIIPSSISYQKDLRMFSGSFDLTFAYNNDQDVAQIQSHDFVVFSYALPNGRKHQIGVGYLDDEVTKTDAQSSVATFNGLELIGQLMDNPFAKSDQFRKTTLLNFIREAVKGEYIDLYAKVSGVDPVFGINNYRGNARLSRDLTQTKGALIQQYADEAINMVYQNRLGQVVLYGGSNPSTSKGVIKKGVHFEAITQKKTLSKVYSEVITFYSDTQANLDQNKVKSPTVLNDDPRVRGVIRKPTYKTFTASDLNVFDVSPEQRIADVAKSMIRRGNSYLSQYIINIDLPYHTDYLTENYIPYELGQLWTLVSDKKEFKTSKFPSGVESVTLELVGFHLNQNEDSTSYQLMFIEPGTLI